MVLIKVIIINSLIAFCEQNEIPIKIPFMQLNEVQKRLVLYGNAKTINFFGKEIA